MEVRKEENENTITDAIDQGAGRDRQSKSLRKDYLFKLQQKIVENCLLRIEEVMYRTSFMAVSIDTASQPFIELEPVALLAQNQVLKSREILLKTKVSFLMIEEMKGGASERSMLLHVTRRKRPGC